MALLLAPRRRGGLPMAARDGELPTYLKGPRPQSSHESCVAALQAAQAHAAALSS